MEVSFRLVCPHCESLIAYFAKHEDDAHITCPCGYDFSPSASERAELDGILEEHDQELAEIHGAIICTSHSEVEVDYEQN